MSWGRISQFDTSREEVDPMVKKLVGDEFYKLFRDVERETKEKERECYYLWTEWYSNWIDLFKWFDSSLGSERYKSLLFVRFFELQKHLLWTCKCIHSGAYHTAIRELRFVFESFIQAYYMDKEHFDSEIECKLEVIKEIEKLLYGSKLIDRTDLENKNKLKKLYSELSKYTHSSYEELKRPIKEGKVDSTIIFTYDKELFEKCYNFTNKVLDSILFILMSFEESLTKKITEDELLISFLKETNCELSLDSLDRQIIQN